MGCGEFIVKYVLFFVNLFFALAGLTLFVLGVLTQLRLSSIIDTFDEKTWQAAPIMSMVVGGIVFIIAFFGCCGAIKESNCMLVLYSIFMLILIAVKVTLATMIFINLDSLLQEVPKVLNKTFSSQDTFSEIQYAFSCCGTTGYSVYNSTPLPDTCCATAPCTSSNAFSGCNGVITDFFNAFGLAIGILAIVVVSVELVATVFGLCLASHVRNKYRRGRY